MSNLKNENFLQAKFFYEKGIIFFNQDKFLEAENCFEDSNKLAPDRISVLTNLAAVKIKLRKFSEVKNICNYILSIDQNNIDAMLHLSIAYGEELNFFNALKLIKKIEKKFHSNFSEVLIYKSVLLNRLGKFHKAMDCYKKILINDSNNVHAKWNQSLSNLRLGNFQEGWKNYHYRFLKDKKKKKKFQNISYPVLSKQNLYKKKLVIWHEQGYGDTIQFIRYVKHFEKYSCDIYLDIPKNLEELFLYLNTKIKINVADNYDYQCSVMDLPIIFNESFKNIKDSTPYFNLPENLVFEHRKYLKKNSKLNVGIAWSGRKNWTYNDLRSISLEQLKPILSLHNKFNFYCLHQVEDLNEKNEIKEKNIEYLGDLNFLSTACFIQNLDLVISVDTSILHLSGSLDQKTIGLLPVGSDWRWFLDIKYSPWYKSIHLYRSNNIGNWSKVILNLKDYLLKL